jgi:hypothetical protein
LLGAERSFATLRMTAKRGPSTARRKSSDAPVGMTRSARGEGGAEARIASDRHGSSRLGSTGTQKAQKTRRYNGSEGLGARV